jgi:peptidoglycan/LPS O-acetylase OafA/YrhL
MHKSHLRKETLFGLEFLRFFLALGVVIPHISNWLTPLSYRGLDIAFHAIHPYCVPIFWTLSGFVFYHTYSTRIFTKSVGLGQFLWNRFTRLYPLAWFTLVLVATTDPVYRAVHKTSFVYHTGDFYHFILNIVLASHWGFQKFTAYNGPIWSVSVELLAYLVFFVVSRTFRPSLWLTLLAYLGAKLLAHFEPTSVTGFYSISTCLQCFFVGGFAYYTYGLLKNTKATLRLGCLVSINLILALLWASDLDRYFIQLLPFAVTFSVQILFDYAPQRLQKLSSMLGSMTYSLYLLHYPVILLCFVVSDKLGTGMGWMTSIVGFPIVVLSLCLLSRLSFTYFEIPVQNRLRRLFPFIAMS